MKTLYHGSPVIVDLPLADAGRRCLDFGKGFYVTNLREQAENWAHVQTERNTRNGIPQLNIYEFDDETARHSNYNRLQFDEYNLEWLDYVVGCRLAKRGGEAMRDSVRWRKQSRIILLLAQTLAITEEAMDIFYNSRTYHFFADTKYGLQAMSDQYIVDEIVAEKE